MQLQDLNKQKLLSKSLLFICIGLLITQTDQSLVYSISRAVGYVSGINATLNFYAILQWLIAVQFQHHLMQLTVEQC
jgi:short subunit fatty acids transporter